MSQKEKEEELNDEVGKIIPKFKAVLGKVKDADVLKKIKDTDKNSWTDDDPSLEAIKKWIKDQPK